MLRRVSWKPEVEGIEERRRRAQELGGPEAVARQHELGRLTIRERIEALADSGSFREQGPLAGHAELDESGELSSFTPANYVLGLAKIDADVRARFALSGCVGVSEGAPQAQSEAPVEPPARANAQRRPWAGAEWATFTFGVRVR